MTDWRQEMKRTLEDYHPIEVYGPIYRMILEQLDRGERPASEIFSEIKDRTKITSVFAVVRALADLEVEGHVIKMGQKKTGFMYRHFEPTFGLTHEGKKKLAQLRQGATK